MPELTIRIKEDYMKDFTLEKMPKDKVEIKNLSTDNLKTKQAITEIMASLEDKDINEVFERLKDR